MYIASISGSIVAEKGDGWMYTPNRTVNQALHRSSVIRLDLRPGAFPRDNLTGAGKLTLDAHAAPGPGNYSGRASLQYERTLFQELSNRSVVQGDLILHHYYQ